MSNIVRVPDPRLREKCVEVKNITLEIRDIVNDLIEVTKQVDKPFNFWLGMAASQIGINKQVFILRRSYKKYDAFINPKIISKKLSTIAISKCYSVEGIYFPKRYFLVTIKYQNLNGEEKIKHFWGGKAWVIQHEMDHLNGILVSDYIGIAA